MKISDYLKKAYHEDPEFEKWLKIQWFSWNSPKRKVRIFIDASLPHGNGNLNSHQHGK